MPEDFDHSLAYLRRLRAEFRTLRDLIADVQRHWSEASSRESKDVAQGALKRLASLRSELAKNFQIEESGGCLEEAVSHQPRFEPERSRLQREQRDLLKRLDALIDTLRRTSPRKAVSPQVEREFAKFVDQLEEHQAAKNRLLGESFGVQLD